MNYLTKFDTNGKRITSHPLDDSMTDEQYAELINEGYIEISEDEWNYYVGNNGRGANGTGYVRGADGKPVDAPPHVPTTKEKKQAIIAQYESDKSELQKQLIEAILYNDTALQEEIKADMVDVDAQFDADIKELEG